MASILPREGVTAKVGQGMGLVTERCRSPRPTHTAQASRAGALQVRIHLRVLDRTVSN